MAMDDGRTVIQAHRRGARKVRKGLGLNRGRAKPRLDFRRSLEFGHTAEQRLVIEPWRSPTPLDCRYQMWIRLQTDVPIRATFGGEGLF